MRQQLQVHEAAGQAAGQVSLGGAGGVQEGGARRIGQGGPPVRQHAGQGQGRDGLERKLRCELREREL